MKELTTALLKETAQNGVVELADVAVDPKFQMRDELCQETIGEYTDCVDELPPVEIVMVDDVPYLVDGFHRYFAFQNAEWTDIPAIVMEGSYNAAINYAMTKNFTNGRRPTKGDASRAINTLIRVHKLDEGDPKAIVSTLVEMGIPKRTSELHTKELRERLAAIRDAKIVELLEAGWSARKIAEQVGCSKSHVSNIKEQNESVQKAQDAESGQSENENDAECATSPSDDITTGTTSDEDDCPFSDEELNPAPIVNPAEAFQRELAARKEREKQQRFDWVAGARKEMTKAFEDNSLAEVVALLKGDEQAAADFKVMAKMIANIAKAL